jgi:hypothetical protein
MDLLGWESVWRPGAYGPEVRPPGRPVTSSFRLFLERIPRSFDLGACSVGTWTGPNGDDLCVRPCRTHEEASDWLAPPGRTIFDAVVRSIWKRFIGPDSTSCDGMASTKSRSSKVLLRPRRERVRDGQLPIDPVPKPGARANSKRVASRSENGRARGQAKVG